MTARLLAAITAAITLAACSSEPVEVTPALVYDCVTVTDTTLEYHDGTIVENYTDDQYWEAVQTDC